MKWKKINLEAEKRYMASNDAGQKKCADACPSCQIGFAANGHTQSRGVPKGV